MSSFEGTFWEFLTRSAHGFHREMLDTLSASGHAGGNRLGAFSDDRRGPHGRGGGDSRPRRARLGGDFAKTIWAPMCSNLSSSHSLPTVTPFLVCGGRRTIASTTLRPFAAER